MELNELRNEIDKIDDQLIQLFHQRMTVASEIGEYKKSHGMRTLDPARERRKLADAVSKSSPDMQHYTSFLFEQLFELSRLYQNRTLLPESKLSGQIKEALENTPKVFPSCPSVACQGIEGAYSQAAAGRFFSNPLIMYFDTFDAVFSAIENGLCDYGVIPIENSTAGSVNQVYDLMYAHEFKIVRSARLKIDHNLVALPGTSLSDVKEVISHPQAISQCEKYLASLPGVKITPCENTARAAKLVADSGRRDIAALSSKYCSEVYGLDIIAPSVQDNGNNYTRFICISKNLEIYPGAEKTSVMLTAPHRPGSLYSVLGKFYGLGMNLIKLESRPIPDKDFEFMFYFDVKASVYSDEFVQLIGELEQISDEFRYLGSYSEVVE